jgi:hypothetical protein
LAKWFVACLEAKEKGLGDGSVLFLGGIENLSFKGQLDVPHSEWNQARNRCHHSLFLNRFDCFLLVLA